MIYCPKCNDMLDKDYDVCPVCGYKEVKFEVYDLEEEKNSFEGSVFDIFDCFGTSIFASDDVVDVYKSDYDNNTHNCQNDILENSEDNFDEEIAEHNCQNNLNKPINPHNCQNDIVENSYDNFDEEIAKHNCQNNLNKPINPHNYQNDFLNSKSKNTNQTNKNIGYNQKLTSTTTNNNQILTHEEIEIKKAEIRERIKQERLERQKTLNQKSTPVNINTKTPKTPIKRTYQYTDANNITYTVEYDEKSSQMALKEIENSSEQEDFQKVFATFVVIAILSYGLPFLAVLLYVTLLKFGIIVKHKFLYGASVFLGVIIWLFINMV